MPGQPQQAREALGTRLREIRQDAGLTARALARLAGWHFTKISKLEHGTRQPSQDDIRAWCRHCQAEDQTPDLIAAARSIDAMYAEWRRQMRAGLKHFQDSWRPLYEQTLLFRVYETTYIPGLLNTAGYASAILQFWAGLMNLPADIDTAIAARMDRQNVFHDGKRRFVFVLEEQALRTRVGGTDVLAAQLDQLLALMSLPVISLGIIPAGGERYALAQGSFWMFDNARVQVETVSAGLGHHPARRDQPLRAGVRAAATLRGLRTQRTGPHRTGPARPDRQLVSPTSGNILELPHTAFLGSHQRTSPDARDRGGMNRQMHAHAGTGTPGLLVTDGGTLTDQELRLGRFRQARPDIEIILRGPWQAVITEPDGERTIVRWELRDLLDQLDKRLGPPARDER